MKRFLRILLITLSCILSLGLLIMVQPVDPVQKDPGNQPFVYPDTLVLGSHSLDSLKTIVGTNKGLPEGFEEAALLAYAAYPELKDVQIDMILTQSGAPMESNFDLFTLLGPKSKRRYKVLLNNGTDTP
ncbi:MAG: hypothetical protein AAF551_12080, partial [Bacteroidota bacterium]